MPLHEKKFLGVVFYAEGEKPDPPSGNSSAQSLFTESRVSAELKGTTRLTSVYWIVGGLILVAAAFPLWAMLFVDSSIGILITVTLPTGAIFLVIWLVYGLLKSVSQN